MRRSPTAADAAAGRSCAAAGVRKAWGNNVAFIIYPREHLGPFAHGRQLAHARRVHRPRRLLLLLLLSRLLLLAGAAAGKRQRHPRQNLHATKVGFFCVWVVRNRAHSGKAVPFVASLNRSIVKMLRKMRLHHGGLAAGQQHRLEW